MKKIRLLKFILIVFIAYCVLDAGYSYWTDYATIFGQANYEHYIEVVRTDLEITEVEEEIEVEEDVADSDNKDRANLPGTDASENEEIDENLESDNKTAEEADNFLSENDESGDDSPEKSDADTEADAELLDETASNELTKKDQENNNDKEDNTKEEAIENDKSKKSADKSTTENGVTENINAEMPTDVNISTNAASIEGQTDNNTITDNTGTEMPTDSQAAVDDTNTKKSTAEGTEIIDHKIFENETAVYDATDNAASGQ